MTQRSAAPEIEFGAFKIVPHRRELLADGRPVDLGGRAFDVLVALVEAHGNVVSVDELISRVWPGRIVEESVLQVQISALRRALGNERDLIQTIAGRGYQFTGDIRVDENAAGSAALPAPLSRPTNLSEAASDQSSIMSAIEFGNFKIVPHRRELLADGQPVDLGGRAFDVLMALIATHGNVVSKDDLMSRVWPGRIVEESGLQVQISTLRKALGIHRDLIQTVAGR